MFGKRLREVRIKRNLTQQKAADALNVALRTYQCYEQGTRFPSFETILAIGDLFAVPIDYLFGRDEFLKSLGVPVDEYRINLQEYPTK